MLKQLVPSQQHSAAHTASSVTQEAEAFQINGMYGFHQQRSLPLRMSACPARESTLCFILTSTWLCWSLSLRAPDMLSAELSSLKDMLVLFRLTTVKSSPAWQADC